MLAPVLVAQSAGYLVTLCASLVSLLGCPSHIQPVLSSLRPAALAHLGSHPVGSIQFCYHPAMVVEVVKYP